MTANKKGALFFNAASRAGKGKRNWRFFQHADFDEIFTHKGEDIERLVASNPHAQAVAVGGDGTINLVINGIMRSGGSKTLGVLYSGTSPDFCRFHGIPIEPSSSMELLLKGDVSEVDVARVTCLGDGKVSYFASSCNIGIGARVASISNRIRKYTGDTLGTMLAMVAALMRCKKFDATVCLDGKTVEFPQVSHVAVLKNNHIASGLYLDIDASPDDGNLHVMVIRKVTFKTMKMLYSGRVPGDAALLKGREVEVVTSVPLQIEYDGDPQPARTPVSIACLNKALRVIK